ncbi:MAG: zinc-dependent metalloprotease family protein [Planctomycetota bacterium]
MRVMGSPAAAVATVLCMASTASADPRSSQQVLVAIAEPSLAVRIDPSLEPVDLSAPIAGFLGARQAVRLDRSVRRAGSMMTTAHGMAVDESGAAVPGSMVQLTTDGLYAYGAVWLPDGTGYELQSRGDGLIAKPFQTEGGFRCGCEFEGPQEAHDWRFAAEDGDFAGQHAFAGRAANTSTLPFNSGAPCFSGDNRVVTILVVFVQRAIDTAIGPDATDAEIRVYAESVVETFNTAIMNSGLDAEARLADIFLDTNLPGQTVQTITSAQAAINALRGPEGQASQDKRDDVCADFVALISPIFSAGGIAQIGGDNANAAFSVTAPSGLFTFNTFAHELGHNLGANHEPGQGGAVFLPEARGFLGVDPVAQIPFVTIMGIGSFNRIPFYSDPDNIVNGVNIGVEGVSDVVNAFETTVPLATRYRERPTVIDPQCDGNGGLDRFAVASNPALDMNFDGFLDFCQVRDNPSLDCDQNGALDEAERLGLFYLDLGDIPLVSGETVEVTVPAGLPAEFLDVATLRVNFDADLFSSSFDRSATVSLSSGPAFTTPFFGLGTCESDPTSDFYLAFGGDAYSEFAADAELGLSTISVSVTPTLPQVNQCGRSITARLQLFVRRPAGSFDPLSIDADLDGVLDACQCPADVNRDGVLTDSDFFAWVTAFTADPRTPEQEQQCDVNLDGACDDSDFFAWVTDFTSGGC